MNRTFISLLVLIIPLIGFTQKVNSKKYHQSIQSAMDSAYYKYKNDSRGNNADYIPALANVPSDLFGIVIVTVDGKVFSIGDVDYNFSIQSISKVFTLALVIESRGEKIIRDSIGVNPTGQVFNSIYPIEQHQGKGINPFVNPGAIATTSLVQGENQDEIFNKIISNMEGFSGTELSVIQEIYESEANNNQRNQAISMLLHSYGRIYNDPIEITDTYTRQCAVGVSTQNLGVMAATIANGGYNPITKNQIISPKTSSHVMSMMTMAGLYDNAGNWLYLVGMPAKSGVGGAIISVLPGKFGIAAFSPKLDGYGNSIRAQLAIFDIISTLQDHPYLVKPVK